MSVRHHPTAEILADYAGGALAPGFALVVNAHLEHCAMCRTRVGHYERASGAALAKLPESELASDALARALSRLDDAPRVSALPDQRSLIERLPLKSRRWVAPGVWTAAVDTPHDPHDRVYLLSVAPGMPTARHEHSGAEFCTVLKGAYRDELGLFRAGDFAAVEGAFNHQPTVVSNEACICLFATEGRLKPHGLLGRLAFAFANV